jgi:hypothetical protein
MLIDTIKTIVICGSTRFIEQMRELETELTWRGFLVFAPTKCDLKTPNPLWADPEEFKAGAARLAEVHYAAMRRCNYVFVYGDYVGKSVREEIRFAQENDLVVLFSHKNIADDFGGVTYTAS